MVLLCRDHIISVAGVKLRERSIKEGEHRQSIWVLTPNDVRHSAQKQIRASSLHSATIRIEIHVAHGLPGTEATEQQLFTVAVDYVDEIGIRLVEPGSCILGFEQWSRGVQSCGNSNLNIVGPITPVKGNPVRRQSARSRVRVPLSVFS